MTDLLEKDAATAAEERARAAAEALIAGNRRRRSIRRWVAIGTLPITLFALLFVGKILSMYAYAHQAVTAYVVADYAGSESAARGQEFLNWFEPYLAPYNIGTALAGAEELDAGRAKLEEALDLATGVEECWVRVNLALVIERQGDAAVADGDGVGGRALYGEALDITTAMPEECSSEQSQEQSPDSERDMEDTKDGLEDRLKEKQSQTGQGDDEQQQQPDEGDGEDQQPQQPDQDQIDELEERMGQGQEERQERQEGEGDEGYGGGAEKPW